MIWKFSLLLSNQHADVDKREEREERRREKKREEERESGADFLDSNRKRKGF